MYVTGKKAVKNPIVESIIKIPASQTDPNGSYTGKPMDKSELPQQDVDDL